MSQNILTKNVNIKNTQNLVKMQVQVINLGRCHEITYVLSVKM